MIVSRGVIDWILLNLGTTTRFVGCPTA